MRHFTMERRLGRCWIESALLVAAWVLSGLWPCHPAIAAEMIPPDRRIDWSPGVPGGIPTYPVALNVKDAPYSAKGDGVADDTAAIQRAINDCPAGKAVFLPEGTFRTTAVLEIKAKGIVLRGAGPQKTRIRCEGATGNIVTIFHYSALTNFPVVAGYKKGSTTVTLASTPNFGVGAHVMIDQENDPTVCLDMKGYQKRTLAQMAIVTAVRDKKVTINRPLYYTFDPKQDLKLSVFPGCFKAGIEDLCVERAVDAGYDNILINCAAYCWIKNLESCKAQKFHVRLLSAYGCEVRDSYFHDGWDGGGGADYGVCCFQRSGDNLIENNVFSRCRHAMIMEYGGCGNVYAYNYSRDPIHQKQEQTDWLMSDMALHGGHPFMNLYEGNIAAHLDCDNYLGGSRDNTFFRNYVERKTSMATVRWGVWAVEVQKNNLYVNVVGNVLGKPPANITRPFDAWRIGYDRLLEEIDPRVAATLLRHGNYNEATQQVEWDGRIKDRKLPASLYLKAKPAFFGDNPWPAIGPDVEPHVGFLPARDRYERELSKAAVSAGPTK